MYLRFLIAILIILVINGVSRHLVLMCIICIHNIDNISTLLKKDARSYVFKYSLVSCYHNIRCRRV